MQIAKILYSLTRYTVKNNEPIPTIKIYYIYKTKKKNLNQLLNNS